MNGTSHGSGSHFHDSTARVRSSAASTAKIAANVAAASSSNNTIGAATATSPLSSSRLTIPVTAATTNVSADTSKYSKRRSRRRRRRQCMTSNGSRLAAALVTMGVTLVVFCFVHSPPQQPPPPYATATLTKQKASSTSLRDKLLAHLPKHSANRNHGDTIDRPKNPQESSRHLEVAFWNALQQADTASSISQVDSVLQTWLSALDTEMLHNHNGGTRWTRPYLLPPLHKRPDQDDVVQALGTNARLTHNTNLKRKDQMAAYFKAVNRMRTTFEWEREWERLQQQDQQQQHTLGPRVDYTDAVHYSYPQLPKTLRGPPDPATYPPLQPLSKLMETWPQDEDFDFTKHGLIQEQLWHFNFTDPQQLAMAQVLRDYEVPFKLTDVPELMAASAKWTDDYVSAGFGGGGKGSLLFGGSDESRPPPASGVAQESANNYFAFFVPKSWNVHQMGLPPTRNSDWNYAKWAKHARYADATQLSHNQPHVYWQAGVDRMERYADKASWTFISRDLPSFASPTENFFVFHPQEQKGIQCRFGERGVVAATHYDGGRNFVGMITGAKRYILSPPNQCSKLGVFTSKKSPIYRHSLLNFAHIQYLNDESKQEEAREMSVEEREWLERASQALSVETVLKAGEALYIPSHWFHYIISVQKSAQCNVRSGIDHVGNSAFGNRETVEQCRDE